MQLGSVARTQVGDARIDSQLGGVVAAFAWWSFTNGLVPSGTSRRLYSGGVTPGSDGWNDRAFAGYRRQIVADAGAWHSIDLSGTDPGRRPGQMARCMKFYYPLSY
jgi:hypothetical protein